MIVFNASPLASRNIPGYIITKNSDTLIGEIKVSHFNILTADFLFGQFNIEQLCTQVYFRASDTRRFKKYNAWDINGFGFKHKNENYKFQSFILKSNTPLKKDKDRHRFLLLCFSGKVLLYKDFKRLIEYNNPDQLLIQNFGSTYLYYEYYLFNEKIGLTKAEISKDIKSLTELLKLYDFENDFIETMTANARLRDITKILIKYEYWKEIREVKLI
ncbi:MAG: hypothetical protein C0597_07885 [Marinilabiliales bacterium]|nr:MAG: hypothetical protein C0597_07885 [Marinilabiliales bacterium]